MCLIPAADFLELIGTRGAGKDGAVGLAVQVEDPDRRERDLEIDDGF